MEELGIGRPSTYAAIIATLQDREYVKLDKRRFVPESKGRLVTSFLEGFFRTYVEYDFTADLEEKLDRISAGELTWREVLREFWKQFSGSVEEIRDLRVTEVLDRLNTELAHLAFPAREDGSDPRSCPTCGTGNLSLKIGKYGAFVGCSNYPECKFTRQLGAEGADGEAASDGPKALGVDPATGEEVTLRSGRFGPYVQRGDGKEAGRSSLPKGTKPDAVDLAMALELLSLPREVTRHPTTGEPILAGIGRFGPYVQHGRTYANLGKDDDVLTIGQNRAIDLIVAKENGGGGRRGGSANAAGKVLGDHPSGGPVSLLDGRYGPYVKHGKVNATLPKGMAPDSVTLEQAVALVDAKGASGAKASPRGKPAAKGKKAAAKPVPAAKAAAGRKK